MRIGCITKNVTNTLRSLLAVTLAFLTIVVTGDDDVSPYYPHSWSARDGWFFNPDADFDNYTGTIYLNVTSVSECARLCSEGNFPGGSHDSETDECFCDEVLACLEPCIPEPGTVFATVARTDAPDCEKSYCEYFGQFDADWCENQVVFDLKNCLAITGRPDSPNAPYYPHSWTARDGWFYHPQANFSDYPGKVYEDVTTVTECARLCSDGDFPGGSHDSETNECFCEETLVCLEPCIPEPGTVFSNISRVEAVECEQSYCEVFGQDDADWCQNEVAFDKEKCLAITGRSQTVGNDTSPSAGNDTSPPPGNDTSPPTGNDMSPPPGNDTSPSTTSAAALALAPSSFATVLTIIASVASAAVSLFASL